MQHEQYYLPGRFGCRCVICSQYVGVALMTHASMTSADYSSAGAADESELRSGSYVDWACALGGAIVAAAISSTLFAFGSGLGLSMLSPWPSERMNGTLFGIVMVVWAVFVPLLSFAVGGYFAGRLRRPWQNLVTEEVAFRDGAHGALVWATSIIIGAILLAMIALGAANLAGTAVKSAANMASTSNISRSVDGLFRTDKPMDDAGRATRDEAQRLVGSSTGLALSTDDQSYLSTLVAKSTGIPAADAEKRVNDMLAQSRAAAETARKAGIVSAFFAAATLLMGLAIAWFAAAKGGKDRDNNLIRLQR